MDTGLTMQRLLYTLGTRNPEAIYIASLLVKPEKLKVNLNIEYVAMEIPNDFIVGYGLDYDGFGRNYCLLYTSQSINNQMNGCQDRRDELGTNFMECHFFHHFYQFFVGLAVR